MNSGRTLGLARRHCASRPVLLRFASTATQPPSPVSPHGETSSPSTSLANPTPDHTASAKLWADAAKEEAEEVAANSKATTHQTLAQGHENWTGDESVRDAVLRMLVDKYKPLRTGAVVSADEKLHLAASGMTAAPAEGSLKNVTGALLPVVEGHKPWLTTFTPPSHSVNVKVGILSSTPSSPPLSDGSISPAEERERRNERQARRRNERAERLARARESTLDYRIGLKSTGAFGSAHSNPVSLKGWASLVEERIERARSEGHFRKITGRGKPLVNQSGESNPFIAREEFLMNRIVQRNGAAPPWVELQTELESSLNAFRVILRESWTRRAVRILTSTHPLPLLARVTHAEVAALRDAEWEAREARYHEAALAEVNGVVRRYNGVAPYAVRRSLHLRDAELARAYRESVEDIMREVAGRVREAGGVRGGQRNVMGYADDSEDDWKGGAGAVGGGGADELVKDSGRLDGRSRMKIWEVVRGWVRNVLP